MSNEENSNVVSLIPRLSDKSILDDSAIKTTKGEVLCLNCHHKWVATAPANVDYLECPECNLMRGVWFLPFSKPEEQHWVCECGNGLFKMTTDSIYCPNCGKDQEFRPHN